MRFMKFCHLLYIAAPQFLLVSLWAMAWRASRILGHWPIYMVDDPKNIGRNDILFNRLFGVVEMTMLVAGLIFLFTFPFIVSLYTSGFSKFYRRSIGWLAIVSWTSPIFDPLGTLGWIMD